jgi:two-component system, OmpR family, sensor kinase
MSIRQRLLLWLLLAVLIAIAIAGVSIYFRARLEANQLFDYHLKQIALTLQDHVPDQPDLMGTLEEEIDYDFVIQVWSDSGEKHYLSHPHKALPPRTDPGYQNVRTDEGEWRVFSMEQDDLLVQVSQPADIRTQLATHLALRTMMPALLLLGALGILIWYIVGRGLQPLERLAAAVRASDANTLQPISPTNLPSELKPLATALNDLLHRLDQAMQAQRDLVADAAHELRTPLTALQLQAQLAERATTDEERSQAFTHLKQGLKRATHLVQQLLTLARQEVNINATPSTGLNLTALVKDVIAEHAPLAQAKRIALQLSAVETVEVRGDRDTLRIMIGNVIDNALRYTPEMGAINVVLAQENTTVLLEISDTGPGIPEAERQRVFDRFYRREGSAGVGSGLGLAIVKRIADAHGIEINLSNSSSESGLHMQFIFPHPGPKS